MYLADRPKNTHGYQREARVRREGWASSPILFCFSFVAFAIFTGLLYTAARVAQYRGISAVFGIIHIFIIFRINTHYIYNPEATTVPQAYLPICGRSVKAPNARPSLIPPPEQQEEELLM